MFRYPLGNCPPGVHPPPVTQPSVVQQDPIEDCPEYQSQFCSNDEEERRVAELQQIIDQSVDQGVDQAKQELKAHIAQVVRSMVPTLVKQQATIICHDLVQHKVTEAVHKAYVDIVAYGYLPHQPNPSRQLPLAQRPCPLCNVLTNRVQALEMHVGLSPKTPDVGKPSSSMIASTADPAPQQQYTAPNTPASIGLHAQGPLLRPVAGYGPIKAPPPPQSLPAAETPRWGWHTPGRLEWMCECGSVYPREMSRCSKRWCAGSAKVTTG